MKVKKSKPNWKNWRKLLTHLQTLQETEHRKFKMSEFIQIMSGPADGEAVSIAKLRRNGVECGSANCLFGEAIIACGSPFKRFNVDYDSLRRDQIIPYVQKLLGLDDDGEASDTQYVYNGEWFELTTGEKIRDSADRLRVIRLEHAISYVAQVVASHNIRSVVRVDPKSLATQVATMVG